MFLFYQPHILSDLCLDVSESQHCVRVLRYKQGDTILITDGKGTTYTAKITNANPKKCEVEIIGTEQQSKLHDFHLHLAVAPPKNTERMEWLVEKCTEIGVDEITPMVCRYSERTTLRLDRLHKIILSATTQSLNPYVPTLNEMASFEDLMANATESYKFIAHCYKDDKTELKEALLNLQKTNGQALDSVLVLIGPEGDFSEQEVENALQRGFVPIGLGKSRLRLETAAVVACNTVILLNDGKND